MKIKNKKVFLGTTISTISLLPFAVVSCSSTSDSTTIKAKVLTELNIKDMKIQLKNILNPASSLAGASTFFDGITNTNLKKLIFEIKSGNTVISQSNEIDSLQVGDSVTISVKGTEGYVVGENNIGISTSAIIITQINIDGISTQENIDTLLAETQENLRSLVGSDKNKKFKTAQLYFKGITNENIDHIIFEDGNGSLWSNSAIDALTVGANINILAKGADGYAIGENNAGINVSINNLVNPSSYPIFSALEDSSFAGTGTPAGIQDGFNLLGNSSPDEVRKGLGYLGFNSRNIGSEFPFDKMTITVKVNDVVISKDDYATYQLQQNDVVVVSLKMISKYYVFKSPNTQKETSELTNTWTASQS